jgi:L-serine deaminase
LKVDATKTNPNEIPLEAPELAEYISKKHSNVTYIEDDTALVAAAIAEAKNSGNGTVIAFLGSHGFRGMIEATVTSLHQQSQ